MSEMYAASPSSERRLLRALDVLFAAEYPLCSESPRFRVRLPLVVADSRFELLASRAPYIMPGLDWLPEGSDILPCTCSVTYG